MDDVEDEVDLSSAGVLGELAVLGLQVSDDLLLGLEGDDSLLESLDSSLGDGDSLGRNTSNHNTSDNSASDNSASDDWRSDNTSNDNSADNSWASDDSGLSSDDSSVGGDLNVVASDHDSSLGWDLEVSEGSDVLLLLNLDNSDGSGLDLDVVSDGNLLSLDEGLVVRAAALSVVVNNDWLAGLLANGDDGTVLLDLSLDSDSLNLSSLDVLDSDSHLNLDNSSLGSLGLSELGLQDGNSGRGVASSDLDGDLSLLEPDLSDLSLDSDGLLDELDLRSEVSNLSGLNSDESGGLAASALGAGSSQVDDLLGLLASDLESSESSNSSLGDSDSNLVVLDGEGSDVSLLDSDNSSPSSESSLGASAWLSVDDDLTGLLADSESSVGDGDLSVGGSDLSLELDDSLGGLQGDNLASPSLNNLGVASAVSLNTLHGDLDDLAGLGASGDSSSVDSDLVVQLDLSSGNGDLDESLLQGGAAARSVSDDDWLASLLANLDLGSEGLDSLDSDLQVVLSDDSQSDSSLLGLDSPGGNLVSSATAVSLDSLDVDDDLAGLGTSLNSGSINSGDSLVSDNSELVSVDLESLSGLGTSASRLDDDLASLGASLDDLSVLSEAGLDELLVLGSFSSESNAVSSELLLDSLATASLVSDNDELLGLVAELDSSSPDSNSLLIGGDLDVEVSVSSGNFSVSQNSDSLLPSEDLSPVATAASLDASDSDGDDSAGLSASEDSLLELVLGSLNLDNSSSGLDSLVDLSDLLATAALASNDNNVSLGLVAEFESSVPGLGTDGELLVASSGFLDVDLQVPLLDLDDGLSPSLDSLGRASARLSSDDDLSGLLADSESGLEDVDSSLGSAVLDRNGDSVSSSSDNLELVSPDLDLLLSAWAWLLVDDDDLSGLGTSGDSVSEDSGSVVKLGLSDGDLDLSEVSSDGLARARLVANLDHLSGLGTSDHAGSPDGDSLGDSLLSGDSDNSDLSVGDLNLSLPLSDVGLRARARLVVNHDHLASLGASDESASVDVLLDEELLSVDSSLDDSNLLDAASSSELGNSDVQSSDLEVSLLASSGENLGGSNASDTSNRDTDTADSSASSDSSAGSDSSDSSDNADSSHTSGDLDSSDASRNSDSSGTTASADADRANTSDDADSLDSRASSDCWSSDGNANSVNGNTSDSSASVHSVVHSNGMDSSDTAAGAVASSDVSDSNVTSNNVSTADTAACTVASSNVSDLNVSSNMSVTTAGSNVMNSDASVDGGDSVSASTVHNVVHSWSVADNVNSGGTLVHSDVVHSWSVVDDSAVASVHSNVVHSRGAVSWGRVSSWGTSSSGWS